MFLVSLVKKYKNEIHYFVRLQKKRKRKKIIIVKKNSRIVTQNCRNNFLKQL